MSNDTPKEVLTRLERAILGTHFGSMDSDDASVVANALREALRERDEVKATLRRLVNACHPLDMWLGGYWTKSLSEEERKEFVHALSAGLLIQQIDDA